MRIEFSMMKNIYSKIQPLRGWFDLIYCVAPNFIRSYGDLIPSGLDYTHTISSTQVQGLYTYYFIPSPKDLTLINHRRSLWERGRSLWGEDEAYGEKTKPMVERTKPMGLDICSTQAMWCSMDVLLQMYKSKSER